MEKASSLLEQLEKDLSNLKDLPPINRYARGKDLSLDAFYKLYIQTHQLEKVVDIHTIIRLNKIWLPALCAKVIFFDLCYRLEYNRQIWSGEYLTHYIATERKRVERFFDDNFNFCRYYDSQSESRDEELFTSRYSDSPPIDIDAIGLPGSLDSGCLLVAIIIAHRQYADVLKAESVLASSPLPATPKEDAFALQSASNVEYKGNKTDLVELAHAMFAIEQTRVDGKPATLEFFIQHFQAMFNVDLKNHGVMGSRMSSRKKNGNTPFLDKLLMALKKFYARKAYRRRYGI